MPLDETRQWFRYHSLFAQVLRDYLARTDPDVVPVLHQRASAWHRQSGSVDEAIGHALAGGDHAGAIDLIAGHWYAFVDSGRLVTVRGWITVLGDNAISAVTGRRALRGVGRGPGRRPASRRGTGSRSSRPANRAEPLPDGMRSLQSSVALLRGVYGFDGYRVMRESAALAVELETDPAIAVVCAGQGRPRLQPLPVTASPGRRRACWSRPYPARPRSRWCACSACPSSRWRPSTWASWRGREELAQTALSIGARGDAQETPPSAVAYLAAGAVYAAQGQLQEARSELEHALQFRQRVPGISSVGHGRDHGDAGARAARHGRPSRRGRGR